MYLNVTGLDVCTCPCYMNAPEVLKTLKEKNELGMAIVCCGIKHEIR